MVSRLEDVVGVGGSAREHPGQLRVPVQLLDVLLALVRVRIRVRVRVRGRGRVRVRLGSGLGLNHALVCALHCAAHSQKASIAPMAATPPRARSAALSSRSARPAHLVSVRARLGLGLGLG